MDGLREQGEAHVFYVLDGGSDGSKGDDSHQDLMRIVKYEFRPRGVRFVNVTLAQVQAQVAQFVRLVACREMFEEHEERMTARMIHRLVSGAWSQDGEHEQPSSGQAWRFNWLVRTRP